MEDENDEDRLKKLPVQSENIGFQAEQMIVCDDCERANPPTRLNCLYCGAELEISADRSRFLRPVLRKPELWEKGFNVILSPVAAAFDKGKIAAIAPILKIETDVLRKIIEAAVNLPVARVESEKEAEIVRMCLNNFGIESFVLSDEKLHAGQNPLRLRGIEFFDDNLILILFNQDEIVEISRENLSLIVTGAIYERRIEAMETRGKKGENKILNTTEIASDEAVIDLYSRADSNGWRILA
ncbi:MAG: hypothetical protein M3T96_00620, partial [Acidobacteriota bacterium]|nr:hypothetical protein [Acidobacteriota bacterium]